MLTVCDLKLNKLFKTLWDELDKASPQSWSYVATRDDDPNSEPKHLHTLRAAVICARRSRPEWPISFKPLLIARYDSCHGDQPTVWSHLLFFFGSFRAQQRDADDLQIYWDTHTLWCSCWVDGLTELAGRQAAAARSVLILKPELETCGELKKSSSQKVRGSIPIAVHSARG